MNSNFKKSPTDREGERAKIQAATAAYQAAGNTIEQVPANRYRKNHGLNRHPNGKTTINIRKHP